MSYEGFKIVSREEAARAEPGKLGGDAIRPAKVKIDKSGGSGMTIEWRDGHTSRWDFAWLRAACPCATCHEAREAEGRAPADVEPVGKYALRFKWNDGHEAGLYSWDYLRNVCDVEARKQRALAP
jgi:DUF971 family protein